MIFNRKLKKISLSYPKLNPYLTAAEIVYQRIKWDINLESWRSRRRLKQLKNQYTGQKAVIVCNGPSLLKSDLSLLKDVFTFGLNKINLLFHKSDFRPSCIVSVNQYVIDQNSTFYNQTSIPLFLNHEGFTWVHPKKNVIFLHYSPRIPKFAPDCSMSIFPGATVTFVAMQLAYHMGFHKVALIGCDHDFTTKGTPNQVVISGKTDSNHFDTSYFSGGAKWQLPDLLQSELYYRLANEFYQKTGRKIVNATIGGKLEVFSRVTLEDFLKNSA